MGLIKNIIVSPVLLLCVHIAVLAQKTVTIKGNVIGDLKGHNKIYVFGHEVSKDSAIINNGQFEITIPFEHQFMVMIYDEYTKKEKGYEWAVPLLFDRPGTLYIKDADIEDGLTGGTLSGMKSAVDFRDYVRQKNNIDNEIRQILQKKYGPPKIVMVGGKSYEVVSGGPESDSLKADRTTLESEKYAPFLEQFVKNHYGDFLSASCLSGNASTLNPADLERIFKLLSPDMQQSEDGKNVVAYLEGLKNSATGKYVKDFVLNTPEGKPLSFSTLKGKYVLIDFWASWCGPCKQSFPHMKELYEKYRGNKFEIYSISTDKSRSDWLNELKNQNLPWLQSLDTGNISGAYFAVTAIPATYLIDPEGKIIMKEVGFEPDGAMGKKLAELFENKGIESVPSKQ